MTRRRYSTLMIAVHWLTALCVLGAWLTSEGGRAVRQAPPVWHFALGLAVLVLLLPRIVARLAGGAPPLAETQPLLRLGARLGHGALYALLVLLPLSGWYAASLMGVAVTLPGGFVLPALTAAGPSALGDVGDIHGTAGNILLILAGLHGLMALYHHFLLRDDTLRRMTPVS